MSFHLKKYMLLMLSWLALTNMLTAGESAKIPHFKPSREVYLSGEQNLLSHCHNTMPLFKQCTWQQEYPLIAHNSIQVEPGFRTSPGTQIVLDVEFKDTYETFYLEIDGVSYPILDGDGAQSFPLPTGKNEMVSIRITSQISGEQSCERSTTAFVRSVKIILDNSSLISQLLQLAPAMQKELDLSINEYQRQLKYARYLKETKETIELLKRVELGRVADDFSGDCFLPSRLLPEECQTLVDYNKILKGDTADFSETQRLLAWDQLSQCLQNMKNILEFLRLASIEINKEYLDSLERAYALLSSN